MQNRAITGLTILAAAAALLACGGNNNVDQKVIPAPVSGVFLDAAVEGLEYSANGAAKQITNASGGFTCLNGETVAFNVGGINLGSGACNATMTPLT